MTYEMFLNVGDIVTKVTSLSAPCETEKNRFKYHQFILKRVPPKIDIQLNLTVIPRYKKFKQKEIFAARRDAPKKRHRFHNRILSRNKPPDKEAEKYLGEGLDWRMSKVGKKVLMEGGTSGKYQLLLDEDLKKGALFLVNSDNKWKTTDIIYGFLQVLTIFYLAKNKLGILVHAAGLKDGKEGYLFAGLSRAGKSTTTRIWDNQPSVKILNDDRIIIRKFGRQLDMYATPWHGDYSDYLESSVEKTELTKLFYIYHKKTNKAQEVSPLEGFNLFFQTLFIPVWDKNCLKFVSNFLLDTFLSKPSYKFGFKNDKKVIDYVRSVK